MKPKVNPSHFYHYKGIRKVQVCRDELLSISLLYIFKSPFNQQSNNAPEIQDKNEVNEENAQRKSLRLWDNNVVKWTM